MQQSFSIFHSRETAARHREQAKINREQVKTSREQEKISREQARTNRQQAAIQTKVTNPVKGLTMKCVNMHRASRMEIYMYLQREAARVTVHMRNRWIS